jgi:molecular chaperone GrpE (heat shock protein)
MTKKQNTEFQDNDEGNLGREHGKNNCEQMLEEPFPNESIVSVALDNIHKLCKVIKKSIGQLTERLLKILKDYENRENNLEDYLRIVADCQKETAKFANNQFERHALYPAIETVFILRNQFHELNKPADKIMKKQIQCPLFGTHTDAIVNAVKLADAKCEYLGIKAIEPVELDDFDPQKHDIKQTIETDESSRHRKIKETLIPGLIYRDRVLQQAKVSVYRYHKNEKSNVKETNNE